MTLMQGFILLNVLFFGAAAVFPRLRKALWGEFESWGEIAKFVGFGIVFGLIIGDYWTLRLLKDSLFAAVIPYKQWRWTAKGLSMLSVPVLLIVYSKLLDWIGRKKAFYVLATFFGISSLIFAYFFAHEYYGLPNTVKSPTRMIGWLWYVFVEMYGSFVVALFWAIMTDITKPGAAKRIFPLIVLGGQAGNAVLPFILLPLGKNVFGNSAPVVGICGLIVLVAGILMWFFMHVLPKEQLEGYKTKEAEKIAEEETGFLEGLKLLVSEKYLLGIFAIVSFFEVLVTIFDFYFKAMCFDFFPSEVLANDYFKWYGSLTGLVAMYCVLFGINNIQRRLGMKISLILTPLLIGVAVVLINFTSGTTVALTVALAVMVCSKAVNYALNGPTLKQLYIPTSEDVRYKSQAWIETFGSRGAKFGGELFNRLRATFDGIWGVAGGASVFLLLAGGLSGVLVIVWMLAAVSVSKRYDKAMKNDELVC
ncbi:MAG: hypothetical protein UR26_C0003G0074 [candidate division TM6 bacterium GW2011_GWF2_32_72]|nr:MAG: hypothetical protein UR26_C0003G0074 [candidate division TM6 bacterium GW2011_GWF2_32_72]